ncbi:MAG: hypothetical protein H6700_00805 [Myxococcales bacterium]|nr:hypothetical protein [Myxococcales bacterium]
MDTHHTAAGWDAASALSAATDFAAPRSPCRVRAEAAPGPLLFSLALLFVAIALTVGMTRRRPAFRALRLLRRGDYAAAEAHIRRRLAARSGDGAVDSALRYNLAVTLHRQGRFAESLAELEQIATDQLDPSLRGAASALFGWNLLYLGADFPRAERCLHDSGPLLERPTTQLGLALLAHYNGDPARGQAILAQVRADPDRRTRIVRAAAGGSVLVIDAEFEALIEEHLLGLIARARGDLATARGHFIRVAHAAHPSFYPRHAAALASESGWALPPGPTA